LKRLAMLTAASKLDRFLGVPASSPRNLASFAALAARALLVCAERPRGDPLPFAAIFVLRVLERLEEDDEGDEGAKPELGDALPPEQVEAASGRGDGQDGQQPHVEAKQGHCPG